MISSPQNQSITGSPNRPSLHGCLQRTVSNQPGKYESSGIIIPGYSRDEGRKYVESSPLCARRPPSVLLVAEGKIEIEACQPLPINRIQSLEGISCRTALSLGFYTQRFTIPEADLLIFLQTEIFHFLVQRLPKICNLFSTSAISRWSSRESC